MTKKKKFIAAILLILFLIVVCNVMDKAYITHASDLTLEQIDQQYHTHFNTADFSVKSVKSFSLFNNRKSILLRSADPAFQVEIEITDPKEQGFDLTHYNSKSNADHFYETTSSAAVYHVKRFDDSAKVYCSTPYANLWISFKQTDLEFDELLEILYKWVE